jgi:eukaryotic-like serine/threonine-protein kinase
MTTGPDILLERVRAATADEYEIDREIGRGGMAAVFLARDIALQRRVAIKVMLPDLMTVQGVSERFVIEARTAAHLDHPGIVTVYAVKQRGGLLFIVMKYIEGHTLEGVLRSQGRLDPIAVALIGSRVAESLHFAHGEGVVHRDVKPSNIMIDPRGRPVVTDFGIARVMTAQSITVAGSMLGTPTHMSPEQCRGLPATAASDQYSLGVTMYEMLTGRVPFTGSLFELITAHREEAPPPVSEFVGGVDPALEHTVMRMLAKDPAQRWSTLTDVVQRLALHTTVHHGDESLRATLSLSGTFHPTPERGAGAVDVLTPPGPTPVPPSGGVGASPISPLPFHSPLSPVPQPGSAQRPAAIVVERGSDGADDSKMPAGPASSRTGIMIGIAAAALVAVIASVAVWGMRSDDSPAGAASSPASQAMPTAPPVAPPATPDSVVRDSIARDSAAKALAARDSARADSAAKAEAAVLAARRDSAAKALPKANPPRRTPPVRPESIAVQCARLLERASLGERLTDAERAVLQRRCPK